MIVKLIKIIKLIYLWINIKRFKINLTQEFYCKKSNKWQSLQISNFSFHNGKGSSLLIDYNRKILW